MGWFDDDDDDDDDKSNDQQQETKKPKLSLADFGPLQEIQEEVEVEGAQPSTSPSTKLQLLHQDQNKNNIDDKEEEEEEDPLEAYMKSLNASTAIQEDDGTTSNNNKKKSKEKAARLDVENEEEATSHWEKSRPAHKNNDDDDDGMNITSSVQESKYALDSMFHKASSDDHRKVNIQLEQVQHSMMDHAPIIKNLFTALGGAGVGNSMYGHSQSTSTGRDWRRQHSISCHPPIDPIYEFAELRDVVPSQVHEWIVRQEGMDKPTLVQSQTLSVALSGEDAIVTASTGSGKTLAYLFPLVSHLMENKSSKSRALILVPTRELALQVEKVAKSLVQRLPLEALAITGGNMGRYQLSQTLIKKKPHVVVATPGRLLDVLSAQQKSKQNWLLNEITFLVLDEADKMLQLGFASQVTQVLDNLRPDRQSLLTSATLHSRLERYCQQWMHQPTRISIGRSGISSEHVQQHVMVLPSAAAKKTFLKEVLPTFCDVGRTIVFCARRDGCEELAQTLVGSDGGLTIPLQTLHGDKHPSDRQLALKAFAKGQVKLLIATDVAGRGLDIPNIATVINYDPAKNWDTHVHRIGRAGRLSDGGQQEGNAYTLLTPSNTEFATTLVQAYQREGRPLSQDVLELSQRRGVSNNNSNNKRKYQDSRHKTGLGYRDDSNNRQQHNYYKPS